VPSANIIRAGNTGANGSPMPQQVFAHLGNSLVAADTGFMTEFCSETGTVLSSTPLSPNMMIGHQCRSSTNITVNSGNVVTLLLNNADGYLQVGTRFTAFGSAV
jgi:hypothetical protein